MSTTTGPFAITPTAPVNLRQPQSGNTLGTLILDNLSGYLLQITVGPDTRWCPPLTEQSFSLLDAIGASVAVSAFLEPGDTETSGQIAATWYGVDETPDGTWPIALSGPAEVAAATAVALLEAGIPSLGLSVVLDNVTLTASGIVEATPTNVYSSIILAIDDTGLAPGDIMQVQVKFFTGPGSTGALYYDDAFSTSLAALMAFTPLQYPCGCGSVEVDVTIGAGSTVKVRIIGSSLQVPAPRAFSQSNVQQAEAVSQAWAAGQVTQLASMNAEGLPVSGQCQLGVFISGQDNATGLLQILNADGSAIQVLAATTATQIVACGASRMFYAAEVVLPRAPFIIEWRALVASTSNYSVTAELTALG